MLSSLLPTGRVEPVDGASFSLPHAIVQLLEGFFNYTCQKIAGANEEFNG